MADAKNDVTANIEGIVQGRLARVPSMFKFDQSDIYLDIDDIILGKLLGAGNFSEVRQHRECTRIPRCPSTMCGSSSFSAPPICVCADMCVRRVWGGGSKWERERATNAATKRLIRGHPRTGQSRLPYPC